MSKFGNKVLGLFGLTDKSKGKHVVADTSTPVEQPIQEEKPVVTSTVGNVTLSSNDITKLMDYTYGYKLKEVDGFVVEDITKHPNLNVVMYTMLHIDTNTRMKINKEVFEFLFESSGVKK